MHLKIFLLACLVTHIYSDDSNIKQEGISNFIIGGKEALPGQFPYIVSIQQPNGWYKNDHFCGGSIIDEKWILTVAHCFRDNKTIVIKAGKHDLSKKEDSEQVVDVKKIFKPKLNEEIENQYDIALLKLRTPLKLNNRVAKIALPKKDSEPKGQGTLAGWGYWTLGPRRETASILQTTTVPIVDYKTCLNLVKKIDSSYNVAETQMCTAGAENGGVGACSGDSGGPLVVTNDKGEAELVGLVSWSFAPCPSEGVPVIYTRVSAFIDWIEDTINANKCS